MKIKLKHGSGIVLTIAALGFLGAARAQAQAPVITLQPTNAIILDRGTATFTVGATGASPLSYVWQFNGYSESNRVVTIAQGQPGVLALDVDAAGNVYMAGVGCTVRKMDTNGVVWAFAGTTAEGFSGDGGLAKNASMDETQGVAVTADGRVYVADSYNHRIRMVDTNGIITTIAGIGPNGKVNGGFGGDGGPATNAALNQPAGLAFDLDGNLLIADQYNHRIRRITADGVIRTIVGGGSTNLAFGSGGYATNAGINLPGNICVDKTGTLYIADYLGNAVEKVDTNGIITFIPVPDGPNGVAVDAAGNLFVSEAISGELVKIPPGGPLQKYAGYLNTDHSHGSPDSFADLTILNFPSGLAFSREGELLEADSQIGAIRKLTPIGPTFSVAAFRKSNPGQYDVTGPMDVIVSNPYGSVTSGVFSIVYQAPPPLVMNMPGPGYTLTLLQYTTLPGSNYMLQVTSDLAPPAQWSNVVTQRSAYSASDNNWSYAVTNYSPNSNCFYRIVPAP